MRYQASGP